MKFRNKIILSSLTIACSFGLVIGVAASKKDRVFSLFGVDSYTLMLNTQKISDQSIAYVGEITSSVNTSSGNSLEIKSSNVITYGGGWQTILPNGYFYNPINDSLTKNKISGISSIRFNSLGDSSLTLHYGYTINDSDIIYSHEKELAANVTYNLSDVSPSYFFIKNNNDINVDILDFSITYSCENTAFPNQNLNVLMIGNSFADDTVFYAARIANAYGITLNIYDAYIAGCTIDQHYTNITNNNATYSMRSMNGDIWDYQDNMTLTDIVNSHAWDVITFQQASAEVGRTNKYSNLTNLVNIVRSLVGPSPKFYWYQTWAYDSDYHDYYDYFAYFNNDQDAMFDAIIDCYQDYVLPTGLFEKMIPAGTAVQNLRTSYMKETTSRDGKHMSSVHGRYLLGLNFFSNVFDVDLDMSPCGYLPPEANESYKNPAYEAIRNAYKAPLAVTQSVYTTPDLGAYNLANYTEIDAELVGCSYWNCTDSTNYNKRLSNVDGSSIYYTSTKRFTSSTLPVGSLVVIDEAFGVRPEAWVSDSVQGSRKDETYENIIEIDENFFDGYAYRAFNIFKCGKTTLMGQFDQVFDGFHIYVPNALVGDLKVKNVNYDYASDSALFASNYLKIDSFERLHLDPITGFYKCDSYYELKNSYVDDTAKKFLCTRPFYSARGDLPENTIIIVDSGYQWRSDCWGSHGSYSPRPGNVSTQLTKLDSTFWSDFRRRTFNISSTSSAYVNQNYISFMNHLRIYVPTTDDIYTEMPEVVDTVTMTALGYAQCNSTFESFYGKSELPVLITLHGDDCDRVRVQVDGSDIGAINYTYDKSTGEVSITTNGSASGYTYGTLTGIVNPDAGTITNLSLDGTLSQFVTNNGSITCSEMWHDRCNYSTKAASQLVWQRWYMSGSWTANSGTGDWTVPSSVYKLDNDYSMGLRIANNSYKKTRFTLKEDFNSGAGFNPHGISIWLYNPNGAIYSSFRIYVYKVASTISGDHAVPNSNSANYSEAYSTSDIGSNEWRNIQLNLSGYGTIYNISFYFETNSSDTTYVYLGHVSFF